MEQDPPEKTVLDRNFKVEYVVLFDYKGAGES